MRFNFFFFIGILSVLCLSSHRPASGAAESEPDDAMLAAVVSQQSQKLPDGWRFFGGEWAVKPLAHHQANRKAVAAVVSQQHIGFPGICKTKKGTLLVVYREGSTHASGPGRMMLVRSGDLGKTWGKPDLVVDDPKTDDRNHAISCMNNGTVCAIYDKWDGALGRGHHWAWMVTSKDDGHTWSEPVKVSKTEAVHTRGRAIDLGNGKWLIPYSHDSKLGLPTAASFFSIYDHKTGRFEEVVATPRGQHNVVNETSVTMTQEGHLVALIRSNTDPQLFQITSSDGGRTWSQPIKSGIPSQSAPADIITLHNGWLVASFSFRDRRDERLVVSRDGGKTWDIENSLDVFDGTNSIGIDRSYPSSVQIDEETIGTALYETKPYPEGGKILFVANKIAQFDAAKKNTLYQADINTEAAFAIWPKSEDTNPVGFEYRFTGRFGYFPNVVGLLFDFKNDKNYVAVEYQMGGSRMLFDGVPVEGFKPRNNVQLVSYVDGQRYESGAQEAAGDWFDDGNLHRLTVEACDGQRLVKIDGHTQFSLPKRVGKPCGIIVRRAAVSVTGLVRLPSAATSKLSLTKPMPSPITTGLSSGPPNGHIYFNGKGGKG